MNKKTVKESVHQNTRHRTSRKLLAFVLAMVFLISACPFDLSIRASANETVTTNETLKSVSMIVRVNGRNNYTVAEVPAGVIADNLDEIVFDQDIPSDALYQRAIMIDEDAGTETEVFSVGKVNGYDYYSIDENSNAGTQLDSDYQKLVLVYAAKYDVTVTQPAHGNLVTSAHEGEGDSLYIWGGENLIVQATADTDYVLNDITYSIDGEEYTSANAENNSATISYRNITGNINITADMDRVSSYSVEDVRYMSESKYYPKLVGVDNHGGITTGTSANDHQGADPVAPGGTAEFYLFSESNSGGSDFVLNMLSINGTDVGFPIVQDESVTTGNITVTFLDPDIALAWKNESNTGIGAKHRSLYKIVVTDVHEDLEIAYNFKQRDRREIIIKDLQGIEETASTIEQRGKDRYVHLDGTIDDSWLLGFPMSTRNYTLTKANNNVYTAYYNQDVGGNFSGSMPSNNMYFYRVKPGYNPYTVSVYAEYYDDNGDLIESLSGNELLAGSSTAGRPDEVILSASEALEESIKERIREEFGDFSEGVQNFFINVYKTLESFNSDLRFWGEWDNSALKTGTVSHRKNYSDVTTSARELALTTLEIEENADSNVKWYAVALNQHESKNQQLYLRATPYEYHLVCDLDGGSMAEDSNYTLSEDDNTMVENSIHTLEHGATYAVLPSKAPTRSGYVFEGWKLYQGETAASNKLYKNNEQFPINETTIHYATGNEQINENQVFTLKAQWTPLASADTTIVSVDIYVQVHSDSANETDVEYDEASGKYYRHVVESIETQVKGQPTTLIDRHVPDPEAYYTVREDSIVYIEETNPQTETGQVPDGNELFIHYDFAQTDFSVEKQVNGKLKTDSFPIVITLTPPNNYPISTAQAKSFIRMSEGESISNLRIVGNSLVYEREYSNGTKVTLQNAPIGWTYKVEEVSDETGFDTFVSVGKMKIEGSEYSNSLTTKTDVVVINQRQYDDPNIDTDKWLTKTEDGYDLTMEAYATAQEIIEEKTRTKPMDIVLVIDQSGSMGNEDMNPTFEETEQSSWTVEEAAGGDKTYYYKVGEGEEAEYYPVQSETGPLYSAAGSTLVRNVVGSGHSNVGGISTLYYYRPHFSIPTNYYYIDSNKIGHKVYAINIGVTGEYYVYFFYYRNESEARSEWRTSINSLGGWNKNKLTEDSTWNGLVRDNKVAFIDDETYKYSWLGVINNDSVDSLYKMESKAAPNRLYYVDDDDTIHYLSDVSVTKKDIAYADTLYEATNGTSRVKALQDAVTTFTEAVAQNKKETGADHQMAFVGFAGNKTPGISRSDGIINYGGYNKSYDYVNTGVFNEGFVNYKQITEFTRYTGELKTNEHYYIDYENNGDPDSYVPIIYSGENWIRLTNHDAYTVSPANYDVYKPVYGDQPDYSNALYDVDDGEGKVNPLITDIIDRFGSYGGTYTSYGIAMANHIFEENPVNGRDRDRFVVVFTDGEPGKTGYDSAIAGEAISDVERTKQEYGAKVYTVGLFVGKPSSDTSQFMKELSSELLVEKSNVSAENLNPQNTYYYYKEEEGKTYSVSTEYNYENSLGWWTSYDYNIRVNPKEDSNDSENTQFYYLQNNRYKTIYVDDMNQTDTYYIKNPDNSNNYLAVNYEYRWYDSDGVIVKPLNQNETNEGIQFFELGQPANLEDGRYYYSAKNAKKLSQMFKEIAETVTTTTNIYSLGMRNTMIRDVVTKDFDLPDDYQNKVKIYEIEAESYDSDGNPIWSNDVQDVTDTYRNSITWIISEDSNTKTLEVSGFDFGANVVSSDREEGKGKKLRIVIEGVKPNNTGGVFESNTEDSGFLIESEEDQWKLVDAFPIPSISRYKYDLSVDEENTDATFNIGFEFQGYSEDGTPLQLTEDITFGGLLFDKDNPTAVWKENAGDEDEIIFEQIMTSESNSGSIHGDNIPDNYKISATVSNNDTTPEYRYSMELIEDDASEPESFDTAFDLPNDDVTIYVSSTTNKYPVTVIKQVKPEDPSVDFSDPTKEFDIIVRLLDKEQSAAPEGNYGGVEFQKNSGETTATISLKSNEQKTFYIPYGYFMEIDEDLVKQGSYVDSYWENGNDVTVNSQYPSTIVEGGKEITVINTITAPVITGVEDSSPEWNWLVIAGVGLLAAGLWTAVSIKRKKMQG